MLQETIFWKEPSLKPPKRRWLWTTGTDQWIPEFEQICLVQNSLLPKQRKLHKKWEVKKEEALSGHQSINVLSINILNCVMSNLGFREMSPETCHNFPLAEEWDTSFTIGKKLSQDPMGHSVFLKNWLIWLWPRTIVILFWKSIVITDRLW